MQIEFTVNAIPIPQPRPRATIIGGHASVYDDKKHPIADFKASVRLAASKVYSSTPIESPLDVHLLFVFPRTKEQLKKKYSAGRLLHVKRGDVDNLCKGVFDALNKFLWVDDCQVCDVAISKRIAAMDEQPHVVVSLKTLEQ